MSVEVRVPPIGESITRATVAKWLKAPGDTVAQDEPLVALDSDKATVELPSPAAGRLVDQLAPEGAEVEVGALIGHIAPGAVEARAVAPAAAPPEDAPSSPAVRRAAREAGVDTSRLHGTGPAGRVTRADVAAAAAPVAPPVAAPVAPAPTPVAPPAPAPTRPSPAARPSPARPPSPDADEPVEVVPMTNLRRRIAERLVEAQQTAAILTTFNEVDMSAVLALRERHQERFQKRYGIKLGFMSFFVKAAIEALKAFPSANAEIRGTDIVFKHHYHIGVAVSGPRGLVVPVVRHADRLSFAETELAVAAFGQRARDNALTIEDLQGGTFSISNGGIFGSLMSTPILNPPQVAILGMHAIQKRAVVVDDQVVVRPMMYLAVSYDHRLLDGREAVGFLVRLKECVESPERILLEI